MYPIKFNPILKEKIWGGSKLESLYKKKNNNLPNIGESWEISCFDHDFSIISNGYLKGKSLQEVLEIEKDKLVGKKIYKRFGDFFPLLFKLIHANDDLSIQVHPNDEVAHKRHNSLGKTEMWVVLDAEPDAALIIGFNNDTTIDEYQKAVEDGAVESLLQKVPVKAGDVFFLPSGMIHAIGKGIIVAEIQESSDLTYRIYDYNRTDDEGNKRDLHLEQALDVIDFSATKQPKISYEIERNRAVQLVECDYFTTNILEFDNEITISNHQKDDSFRVFMCIEGEFEIMGDFDNVLVSKGETVLIPASMQNLVLKPKNIAKILEVFVP